MKHKDRLVMLNARAGTMPRATVILPIELIWEDEEKATIRLNAYNETTPNRATLIIVPKAYLGWQGDLQKDNYSREYAQKGFTDGAGAYTIANDLEAYRVKNAEAIVTGLRKMYFEGRPGSLYSL